MLALSVLLSISGCSTVENDNYFTDGDGFSFVVSIENTRANIVNNNGAWQTVMSGNDRLYVTSDKGDFIFTNTTQNPYRFASEDENAEILRDASNIVITTLYENGCVMDSNAGKGGIALRGEYKTLPKSGKVTLYNESAFFRLSCSQEVTLMADAAIFSGVNGSNETLANSVTVGAGDDIWVAFMPCVERISLSAMVAGATAMHVEDIELSPCAIYTLGRIIPESEPEPQKSYIYLVPNDEWKSDGAWFVAYFWEGDNNTSVKLTDDYGDGIYGAAVPTGMTNMLFCRMNPAYTEFAWGTDCVWAQTADLTVGEAPYNYYYITGPDSGEWNRAGYDPNPPVVDEHIWSVSGTFNNWGDTPMSATNIENIYVKQGLELRAGDEFKIKLTGSWSRNFGGDGDIVLTPNLWVKGYHGGANIIVGYGGVYDIYLDSVEERIYLMSTGVDYTTAKEYGNDDNQAPSPDMWGLCGTHNDWGVPDIPLIWDNTIGLYVAYNATLTGEFKVRSNNSWKDNYGCDSTITIDDAIGTPMTPYGSNCKVASGTYDIYFCLTSLQLWVRTPGSEAPTIEA